MILLFFMAPGFNEKGKPIRSASVFLFLGGIIGGCFATPSRGMPNGMPGALAASMLFIVVGVIMIVNAFRKKASDESAEQKKNVSGKVLVIAAAAVFVIFVISAFAIDSTTSHSDEPWRDLGVSEREYMEIYNYYKYGNP